MSTKPSEPKSAFELFKDSKNIVMANIQTYAILFLLPFLFSLSSNTSKSKNENAFGKGFAFQNISPSVIGFGFLFAILILAVISIVNVMQTALNFNAANGKKLALDDLWPYVKKYGFRMTGLAIVTGLIVALGLVALIVPGVIFIRRYYLAPYLMLDKDLSISDSLSQSAALTKPFASSIYSMLGVTILLSVFTILPLLGWVIAFVLTSLYTVAPALRYVELKKLEAKI